MFCFAANLQSEGLWQPCLSSKSIDTIIPTKFVHFVSLCYILVILTIFQTFSWLYLLCLSVEKVMATHSSTLAWKIPWTEEPGRLSPRGHKESDMTERTSLSLFTFMHWRRKWQPTPVFLPGKSQGQRSLVGCWLRDRTESDITGAT